MYRKLIPIFALLTCVSCSPRDFLTRRLAADLIAASSVFKAPRQFVLHTGIISNKEYLSPDYLVLQHHGWISATTAACPLQLAPPPCWDVVLTPLGADTIHVILPGDDGQKSSFDIPCARRELIAITGITRHDGAAEVDFTWKWFPLNEVGAAIFSADLRFHSTVSFRSYDDGWRVQESAYRSGQPLDESLQNADPVQ